MALSVMLRSASKFNAVGITRATTRLSTPLKTITTRTRLVGETIKPISLLRNVQPITRSITLSAPKMAAASSNHTVMWTAERLLSILLLGVVPAAFLHPSKVLDGLLAVSVVLHSYWGIEAIITDYARPQVVGPLLPKIAHGSLLALSIATLGGLFYIIQTDVGIAKSIQQIWRIKGHNSKPAEPAEPEAGEK